MNSKLFHRAVAFILAAGLAVEPAAASAPYSNTFFPIPEGHSNPPLTLQALYNQQALSAAAEVAPLKPLSGAGVKVAATHSAAVLLTGSVAMDADRGIASRDGSSKHSGNIEEDVPQGESPNERIGHRPWRPTPGSVLRLGEAQNKVDIGYKEKVQGGIRLLVPGVEEPVEIPFRTTFQSAKFALTVKAPDGTEHPFSLVVQLQNLGKGYRPDIFVCVSEKVKIYFVNPRTIAAEDVLREITRVGRLPRDLMFEIPLLNPFARELARVGFRYVSDFQNSTLESLLKRIQEGATMRAIASYLATLVLDGVEATGVVTHAEQRNGPLVQHHLQEPPRTRFGSSGIGEDPDQMGRHMRSIGRTKGGLSAKGLRTPIEPSYVAEAVRVASLALLMPLRDLGVESARRNDLPYRVAQALQAFQQEVTGRTADVPETRNTIQTAIEETLERPLGDQGPDIAIRQILDDLVSAIQTFLLQEAIPGKAPAGDRGLTRRQKILNRIEYRRTRRAPKKSGPFTPHRVPELRPFPRHGDIAGLSVPGQTHGHRTGVTSSVGSGSGAGLFNIRPISEVAARAGILPEELFPWGRPRDSMAKIDADALLERLQDVEDGSLVLISGTTPTTAGEGKTTTEIGLADALNAIGIPTIAALREPSLGPVFGKKGGATGSGKASLFPASKINGFFTYDFPAISYVHNLMLEAFYNAANQPLKKAEKIVPRSLQEHVTLPYNTDMNARALREIDLHLPKGIVVSQKFILTAASEVMAILTLANDREDLRARLEKIVIAWPPDGDPLTLKDLAEAYRRHDVEGKGVYLIDSLMELLEDAFDPNLVQTLEGNPVIVHAGPFANIGPGTNGQRGTRVGLKLTGPQGVVLQETGFGSDLGALKFLTLVTHQTHLRPKAVVVVTSARALKLQGGADKDHVREPNTEALRRGFANLDAHVALMQFFGIPVIVAINRFEGDPEDELEMIRRHAEEQGVAAAVSDVVAKGSKGGEALARAVVAALKRSPPQLKPLYDVEKTSLVDKVKITAALYGASEVDFSAVEGQMERLQRYFGHLPIMIAKTQYSLSDDEGRSDPAPKGWTMTVKHVEVYAGAGYVRVDAGEKPPLLNPGLDDVLGGIPKDAQGPTLAVPEPDNGKYAVVSAPKHAVNVWIWKSLIAVEHQLEILVDHLTLRDVLLGLLEQYPEHRSLIANLTILVDGVVPESLDNPIPAGESVHLVPPVGRYRSHSSVYLHAALAAA